MSNKGKESGKTVKTNELQSQSVGGAKGKNQTVVTLSVVQEALANAIKNHPNAKNMSDTAMATYTKQELLKLNSSYDVDVANNKIVSGNYEFPISGSSRGGWGVSQQEKKDKAKK